MTAEIVIMNSDAVAMASDSVVTIGNEYSDEKTYPSANKLFAISYDLPVGIMTYGNGKFMDLSWETLIKMYRKKCKKPLNHLKEYVDDFLNFLKGVELYTEEHRKQIILQNFYAFHYSIRETIAREIDSIEELWDDSDEDVNNSEADVKGGSPTHDIPTTIMNILNREIDSMEHTNQYQFESEDEMSADKTFLQSMDSDFESILLQLYGNLYAGETRKLVDKLTECHFTYIGTFNYSGIVISGYGENDIFPKTYSLMMREAHSDGIIYACDLKDGPGVFPFAQRDMVDLFMTGFSRKILANILNEIDTEFPTDCQHIKETIARSIQNDIDITIQLIQNLPKAELAVMAETLVNLTSFKKMFSRGMETVGGPIDVAVISKGDGFIWIKRKHYFEPELNPHFIARHYI